MPIEIKLVLDDENLAKLASALLGGTQPQLTNKSSPPEVADAKATKKAAKDKPAPAPVVEEEPAEEAAAATTEEDMTSDLVTEAQNEAANETAAAADVSDIRGQLTDYYVGQGSSKKEVQNAISGMSEEELRAAYLDYLARLVIDETGDFTGDFENAYIAVRIDDGKEVKHWIKGGVTLTEEQCTAAKLADPNGKPAVAIKKPGLPLRKSK